MKSFCSTALLFLLCVSLSFAQEVEDPIHDELRALRAELIKAIETRDIDKMLAYVHPEATVTWQNGDTSHGIEELRAFYDSMGKDAFVAYTVPHEADQLSVIVDGDTAISSGRVVADYVLLGKSYQFESRWTATFVLEDGKWLIAAYHVSLNALDNPILSTAKSGLWISGAIGLVVGMALAMLICRLRRKSAA